MKIVFMGTPDFAVPILEGLAQRYEVVLVVSQPDRIRKKGVLFPTPVKAKALELGIPVHQPEKIGDDYEKVSASGATVLVSAAYGQYVPSKVLNLFQKTINVHGSLLPKYRGGAPIQRCIMDGASETGITLIEMARKLDAGRMYAKCSYTIQEEDTSTSVFEALSKLGAHLLLQHIESIVSGENAGEVQVEQEATTAPNLLPDEEKISFDKPAFLVARHIHALAFEPGAYVLIGDTKLKVFGARVVKDETNAVPGTVLSLKKRVLIKTKEDAVELTWLLMPGKKMVSAKDFVNGQKLLKENEVI